MPEDDEGRPKSAPLPPEPEEVAPEGATEGPTPPEDWANRYRYLLADFENYRRRTEREREGISRQARGALIRELLPILEAFRSARAAVGSLPPNDPVRHGLDLLDREWTTFLKHEGVTPMAEVGQPFHSDEHEAVGETGPREGIPEGAIAEVVQQGYRFYGGVLRPAKVIVARARPAAAAAAVPSPEESA